MKFNRSENVEAVQLLYGNKESTGRYRRYNISLSEKPPTWLSEAFTEGRIQISFVGDVYRLYIDGIDVVRIGDWIVKDIDGLRAVDDDYFKGHYRELLEEPPEYK